MLLLISDILRDSHLVTQLNTEWDKYGPILLHLTHHSCKDPVAVSRQIRDYYMKKQAFGDASAKQFVEVRFKAGSREIKDKIIDILLNSNHISNENIEQKLKIVKQKLKLYTVLDKTLFFLFKRNYSSIVLKS